MTAVVPTVILCGGRGTRIADPSSVLPKPMLPIGGRPVLWHIMKTFASQGHDDFVLALGWLGDRIKEYFLHHAALTSDFRITVGVPGAIEYLGAHPDEGWRVTCVDTGVDALTGTRVRRVLRYVEGDTLMLTYGDGVGDVDVNALLEHHRRCGRLATITAVRPPGRFGELRIEGDRVVEFAEKPQTTVGAISGGFMVLERAAVDRYIPSGRDVMLEREPLGGLAADGELTVYRHEGFWQPMDTPRERDLLEELWQSGRAPWRTWRDD